MRPASSGWWTRYSSSDEPCWRQSCWDHWARTRGVAPAVTCSSASTATVIDCMWSTSELAYANTGKPVPPITPRERAGVTSILVLAGGTLKVANQTVVEGPVHARLVIGSVCSVVAALRRRSRGDGSCGLNASLGGHVEAG
jgi:hypothetical protein